MVSMARYQPALDAREIKHFLDARAKGITPRVTGCPELHSEAAQLWAVRVDAIVMCIYTI